MSSFIKFPLRYKIWFSTIILLTLVIYLPSINSNYFGDDLAFKFQDETFSFKNIFLSGKGHLYRPLEKLFLMSMQKKFNSTLPIHIGHLILHISFCTVLLVWMKTKGFSTFASLISFSYMSLSQASSHAVSSLDTFSQLMCTFSGYLSIAMYYNFITSIDSSDSQKYRKFYLFSFLFYIISLLSKESGVFVLPIITILSLIKIVNQKIQIKKIIFYSLSLLPFLISILFLLYLRKYLKLMLISTGNERYNIRIGINIAKNILLFLVQSLQPHSSVSIFIDIMNKRYINIILPFLFSLLLVIIIIFGIFSPQYKKAVYTFLIMLPMSIFPFFLFNKVSELYVYNTLPIIAILVGIGFEETIKKASKLYKILLSLLLVILLLWNSISTFKKSLMIYENGEEANNILSQLKQFYSKIPLNGSLLLVVPDSYERNDYSIYKRIGFRLLQDGFEGLYREAKRNDFSIAIIKESDVVKLESNKNSLLLGYKNKIVYNIKDEL